ncbi:hypothetical protein CR203_19880 [Salipaludibacillus neizhouensis]|uniref:YufK family protein n=1 Tax=Salipaludibacillus neizhouensis TaxID=885475 RepID=A0A3A9K7F4_9BACI|nr:DUF5366 family protein [Salipaludibacillus neizhouensis]RKL65583.1 hypothetical protein CR203_19880 [Salipaludibacillus neizhouensis]
MKNTYLTSHFPLIAILLFGLSFAIYIERLAIQYLQEIGLYSGMIEFLSARGIDLILLFVLWLFFFMLFAAMKLIAVTVNELSLLFFSRDQDGSELKNVRKGSWIFLIGGIASVPATFEIFALLGVFVLTCFIYFIYFIYRVSDSLSAFALIGLIFFHLFFWFAFVTVIFYAVVKLYNSIIAGLPV